MKNYRLLIFRFLFFTFLFFLINSQAPAQNRLGGNRAARIENSEDGANALNLERLVFALINKKRTENNLQPLLWSEQAAQAARLHSKNMSLYNFFSHIGLDGKRVDGRADLVGLKNWRMIGENIAYNRGYGSPIERVIESWMNSSGHRENLLNKNWRETGVGINVTKDGTYYFTQVFVK
ncbi:MAG TPA: CAP domain-containing protein [Pyrinomonadaceae bacterium]|jgi:uncharacterized protein YkwD|nr:CAP domain-containing protein [Pyrinomonadaceae bacterium]